MISLSSTGSLHTWILLYHAKQQLCLPDNFFGCPPMLSILTSSYKLISMHVKDLWDARTVQYIKQMLAALPTQWISLRCAGYPPYKTADTCYFNLPNKYLWDVLAIHLLLSSCYQLSLPDESPRGIQAKSSSFRLIIYICDVFLPVIQSSC
jgi:hypothetical protein